MKRLALLLAVSALLLPGAGRGAACTPLDCSTSQFTVAHGTMLAVRGSVDSPIRVIDLRTGATRWRLPSGVVAGDTLVSQSNGRLLTWYSLATGARLRDAVLQLHGVFQLVGSSQHGRQAVLARTQQRSTTFAIVSPTASRIVKLGGGEGQWAFDALRGSRLVLIRYVRAGYQIRLYDLTSNRLDPKPLKAPGDSAVIQGAPTERMSSVDGRFLFTLYIDQNGESMVHALDLENGTARCVDLKGNGDWNTALTTALALSPDGRTLYAVSPGYGRVTAIDVASRRVRASFAFEPGAWNSVPGTAVVSRNGSRIAVTDAQHIWFVDLANRKVAAGPAHVAIALGWSPDQQRLWVVGERSRVSPLPPG